MVSKDNGARGAAGEDWRDLLYLYTFLDIGLSNRALERHERVWIRRFLANRGKPQLYRRMDEIIAVGHVDAAVLQQVTARAVQELSPGEKRRFIYNLVQLFESKGKLSGPEYDRLLDIATTIGIEDTEADSMIQSVFSLNDSILAVIGALAGGAILYLARSVVVPLVIAILLTMIIYRVEGFITQKFAIRRLRWLTRLGSTLLILAAGFALVLAAVASGTDIAQRFGFYQEKLTTVLHNASLLQNALSWLRAHGVGDLMSHVPVADILTGLARRRRCSGTLS